MAVTELSEARKHEIGFTLYLLTKLQEGTTIMTFNQLSRRLHALAEEPVVKANNITVDELVEFSKVFYPQLVATMLDKSLSLTNQKKDERQQGRRNHTGGAH